jgi:hypothetical protein
MQGSGCSMAPGVNPFLAGALSHVCLGESELIKPMEKWSSNSLTRARLPLGNRSSSPSIRP